MNSVNVPEPNLKHQQPTDRVGNKSIRRVYDDSIVQISTQETHDREISYVL